MCGWVKEKDLKPDFQCVLFILSIKSQLKYSEEENLDMHHKQGRIKDSNFEGAKVYMA